MTTADSLCVKCRYLHAYLNSVVIAKGKRHLISECCYGGNNAGNRKQCKKFSFAPEQEITARIEALRK